MLGKLLLRYLKPYRWLLLGVLVFQFASAIASLYLPSLNADIIDQGVAVGDTDYILRTGAIMLGVALLQILCSVTAVWFSAAFTEAVVPPPFDVITGASLTFVTVTAMSCTSVRLPPSVTVTCTS